MGRKGINFRNESLRRVCVCVCIFGSNLQVFEVVEGRRNEKTRANDERKVHPQPASQPANQQK